MKGGCVPTGPTPGSTRASPAGLCDHGERVTDAFFPVRAAARAGRAATDAVGERLERGTLAAVDAAFASRVAEEVVDRAIASGLVERLVDRLVDRLLAERVLERAIDSVFDDGRVIDELVTRLIDSEDLWVLVEEIAQSPAVTDAIGRQSIGFADQVAGGVRARSRTADERLERVARRALRRPQRGEPQAPA
jgi:hypothetical protein